MKQLQRPRPTATPPGASLLSLGLFLSLAACRASEPSTGPAALAMIDEDHACRRSEDGVPAVFFAAADIAELERAMGEHLVVVHLDCQSRRVLPACRAVGAYTYASAGGTAMSMVDLRRGDASFEMTSSIIGQRTAPVDPATQLEGDCEGATHVLRAFDVGAFFVRTVSAGQSTDVARETERKSGDFRVCDARARESQPPPQCAAPVTLYLAPVAGAGSR